MHTESVWQVIIITIITTTINIAIAITVTGVPAENCIRARIEQIKWSEHKSSMDVVVDWWTLSYLEVPDIQLVVEGVFKALKPGGIYIVCVPVTLARGNKGGHCDVGMIYYAREDYNELFKRKGF